MAIVSTVVLIGILAGAVVFVGTLCAVYFLLQHGGSFERMKHEAVGMPSAVGEIKPLLYDQLLEQAKTMARKPAALKAPIVGELISIRNVSVSDDATTLFEISNGQPRCATKPIGMLSLCDHSPRDLRVTLGDVWLVPAFQGSGVLSEAVLLMLKHLFALNYRRVEWRCDGHNVRARRAAHSLGFTFEGVLRKHRVVKDCNCDTVVFAVINSDWPAVEEHLTAKVGSVVAKASAAKEGTDKKNE
ncbi:hypothetical protein P43SY_001711 [Pythium insidiosum]|uniref:N-acetyltransferase domain-containing protein n=1 Tax=Pythium insidiosum TaxID=114742 RepID=A0AAD5LVY6_PYTIN|nr:hypothetical protein P43SY_001711 [Pythium insidiosum]